MKNVLQILILGLSLLGCSQDQNTKTPPISKPTVAATGRQTGLIHYGSKTVSVPLYDLHGAPIKPKNQYFYSEKEAASQGISEVKLACVLACASDPISNTCVIDPNVPLIAVVHYTYSCTIEKCPDHRPKYSDSQSLGEGIEIHLDPTKNRMDCNGIQVEIPPHPARSS